MTESLKYTVICLLIMVWAQCCTSTNVTRYYNTNQKVLDSMEESFRTISLLKPFTLEFTDREYKNISLEIITDTIKYVYEFEPNEKRFQDTIIKYKLNGPAINKLISQMQQLHCTWINNLDYYVGGQKRLLVYISIRERTLNIPFINSKYIILSYFTLPQHFDQHGRLITNRRQRRIRKINDAIFRRINDKVVYSFSSKFR